MKGTILVPIVVLIASSISLEAVANEPDGADLARVDRRADAPTDRGLSIRTSSLRPETPPQPQLGAWTSFQALFLWSPARRE